MLDPDEDPLTDDFPHVINNSWVQGFADPFSYAYVEAWSAAGIVPVFCIGNDGPDPGTTRSPGNYDIAIGVGSTTWGGSFSRSRLAVTCNRRRSSARSCIATIQRIASIASITSSAKTSSCFFSRASGGPPCCQCCCLPSLVVWRKPCQWCYGVIQSMSDN